jgi:VacB/RNase II family 3'-5' exoribonuclease
MSARPEDCDRARLESIARRVMTERGLEPDFPPAALAEAQHLAELDGDAQLADLRDLPWCSIDNDSSRDLDQLTVAASEADGAVRVRIAIADVAAAVRPGSALDAHAAANTVSVYTPAHVFPMLPERLSTDLTSLVEGAERGAWVTEFVVGADGAVRDGGVSRARVRNQARLVYRAVGAWLEGRDPAPAPVASVPGLADALRLQDRVAQGLRARRHEAGALDVDTMEFHARFDGDRVTGLEADPRNRARDLIEDLMIAANGVVARLLEARRLPLLRRVVRAPERWPRIVAVAAEHGASLPPAPDPRALNAFLVAQRTADPDRFPDLSLTVVKLLGRGRYEASFPGEPAEPHFGLAVTEYTHSTAPNRRYPDLVTQRLLGAAIGGGTATPYERDALTAIAERCTQMEDAAQKVERLMRKAAAACLLASHVGDTYQGVVTGASPKGTWVRVFHPPVEGRIEHGWQGLDVGDRVTVKLVHTDVDRGFVDFARVAHVAVGRTPA